MMKDGYFTRVILCVLVLHAHVHAPVLAATEAVFQMTKCDTEVEPAWTSLANLTISDSLQCARACYANSTCEHVSFYQGTCILWQGAVTCGIRSGDPWEFYKVRVRCEAGWYRYQDSCYLSVASPSTWVASVAHCESVGAHLVSTRSLGEEAFIVDLISSLYPSWNNIWIGAHNSTTDGEWEWVSGEPWDFEDWKWDQPSAWWIGLPESCVEMEVKASVERWNDAFCDGEYDVSYNFVCEKANL